MAMWNPLVFPRYFTTKWHDFNAELITKDTDAKVAAMQEAFPEICASILEFEGHSQVIPVLEEVGGCGGGGVGSRRISSIARNVSTGGFPSVREGSEMVHYVPTHSVSHLLPLCFHLHLPIELHAPRTHGSRGFVTDGGAGGRRI
jgi:hypothetical protein